MKNQNKASRNGENSKSILPKMMPYHENITLINPKKEPLTPAVLKTFERFENISDEEAENICRTSLLFAQVLLECTHRYKAAD